MDDFVTFYVAGNAAIIVRPHCKYVIIPPSGQDTTASTLSFAIILTHQHPQILDRYFVIWAGTLKQESQGDPPPVHTHC